MITDLFYLVLLLLIVLFLVLKQKNYWKENFALTLSLKRELVLCVICIGFFLVSTELHKTKHDNIPKFEMGSFDQSQIDSINIFDRTVAGKWDIDAKDTGKIFKYIAIFIIPFSLLFYIGSIKRRLSLLFIFIIGYKLTEYFTGLAKGLVNRFRPFTYRTTEEIDNLSGEAKEKFLEDIVDYDVVNSFFSGDTSLTAYGFVFFAFAYQVFYKESKYKKVVWAVSVICIILVCYYRAMSGKHFPSDVIIGALVGSLIAFSNIKIHNPKSKTRIKHK
jgi:membrane-associated phospholipid phosphatase